MIARGTHRHGFTLVEVLLVILILGMLAGVAIVALTGTREGAKIDTTQAQIREVVGALDRYNMDIGHYPTEEEGGLEALVRKPGFEEENTGDRWRGPYLKKEPVDAFGNPLNYEVAEDDSAGVTRMVPHVWSSGPDGVENTDDDIKSWSAEEDL